LRTQVRHTGLQAQQLNHVAIGNGQFRDLDLLERVAERRVGAIDQRAWPSTVTDVATPAT